MFRTQQKGHIDRSYIVTKSFMANMKRIHTIHTVFAIQDMEDEVSGHTEQLDCIQSYRQDT